MLTCRMLFDQESKAEFTDPQFILQQRFGLYFRYALVVVGVACNYSTLVLAFAVDAEICCLCICKRVRSCEGFA